MPDGYAVESRQQLLVGQHGSEQTGKGVLSPRNSSIAVAQGGSVVANDGFLLFANPAIRFNTHHKANTKK
ncbi:MAG: hypothetical protein JNJ94_00360 [Chlorobi bacterium]|nr:hypothetical protein [Chlorobiota bacterium]